MKTRIITFIIIAVVIAGLILYGALSNHIQNYNYEISKSEYLANQPTINVTGIIQYWQPIDGPSFSIIPEEDIDFEINEHRGIFLYGQLSSSLEGKRVTVSGTLIENYVDYQLKTLGGAFGGDPNTAVILVDDVFYSESKELECLRLYKDIKELSGTPEMLTAEREALKQQKDQIIKYVESNCPDFKDLDLIYDNFVNIP